MKENLDKNLLKLINNKTSGSSELLTLLHDHIKQERKNFELFPSLIIELQKKFTSFQNINSYLDEFYNEIKNKGNLEKFFYKYDEILINVYDNIFLKAKNELLKYSNFITISNSKTVYEILKRIKKEKSKITVFVSESRPKFEGRILARKLAEEKINVYLITEAMLSNHVKNSDAALIGADIILKNGNVVNKVGSSILAILCKFYKVPFFVVAHKSKFSSKNTFDRKEMHSTEIWRNPHLNIEVPNYYFEEIDKKLIKKIFTS
ncbi:MAG: hypothetical protein QHH13_00315 [Melioribacter sp.]|uniref:hypothetical protein n=1 Tax=Rosettibacter primus TaxID=3111523 RepID=UPI00247B3CF9|nr:hypothetical protein [Melioribacter sp.]